jgi:3-keto-disaccharide hydrolase
MRRLLLPLMLICAPALADDSPARGFFDGKSLDGWEGMTQYWSVKDGAIVGSTEPKGINFNTFLCSKRKFKDFELSFQIRLKEGQGNSGVQIRSSIFYPKTFAVKGPQCDIGEGYWGSLFGEHHAPGDKHIMLKQSSPEDIKKAVKPKEFNDYKIKCVGQHVTITINGTTTVDGDFPTMAPEGIIAFQIHGGGPMEVTFRNFEFKEIKGN